MLAAPAGSPSAPVARASEPADAAVGRGVLEATPPAASGCGRGGVLQWPLPAAARGGRGGELQWSGPAGSRRGRDGVARP